FHGFNRAFLLGSFIVSLAVPLIKIPYYISLTKETGAGIKALVRYNELLLPEITITTSGKELPGREQLLFIVYTGIALFFIIKIMIALFLLFKRRFQNSAQHRQGVTVIATDDPAAPYSFFNWLFWSPAIDDQTERGRKILQHEMCHMQQLHSLDMLFAELLTAIMWINPFFWLIKKELKAVHEFSADAFACRNTGALAYAELLITEALLLKRRALVNPFFGNELKRRITMLTTNPGSTGHLRRWMALPLFIVAGALFTISCQSKDKNGILETHQKADKEASYAGNWAHYLQENLRGEVPVDNGAGPGNYQTVVQFVVDESGNVSNISVVKDPGFGMGNEAIRVIRNSGKWQPATVNGQPVKTYRKQPITFQIQEM
ncbi:MAG TPA: M56 family metallopeptidase, partial [Niabella sp.]